MDGTKKPHIEKYKDIKNYCNYDTICIVTSHTVCDSKILKPVLLLYKMYKELPNIICIFFLDPLPYITSDSFHHVRKISSCHRMCWQCRLSVYQVPQLRDTIQRTTCIPSDTSVLPTSQVHTPNMLLLLSL